MDKANGSVVQTFGYRQPRMALELACDFLTENAVIKGTTQDCSESGMRICFQYPVREGSRGRLRLKLESCWFEVEAEVIHSDVSSAGLTFNFASEAERRFLRSVLRLAARTQRRV